MNKGETVNTKSNFFSRWIEIITWAVMIIVLIFIRFLPKQVISNDVTYYLIGAIVGFALLYYLVINRLFSKSQSMWIKDFSDVVIISVLIILAKDYGSYFYSLYFLPIAAATMALGAIDSLLIATVAALFVVLEIFLHAENILPNKQDLLITVWQVGFIVLITIFCRFLALQARQERKEREDAVAKTKAIEIIEKREREFMTLTSHQLYTPLSMIRGFSSILRENKKTMLTKKEQDYINEIYINTRKMIDLISQLLSISRIRADQDELKMCDVQISTLISHIIEQLQPKADEKKNSLNYIKPNDGNTKVCGDALRLEQALFNLIDNAIKFTDKGKVEVKVLVHTKEITIAVSDTGRGISAEDKEKLFQPFNRGKNILELEKDGTGLGLYLTKTIVEKHKGHVWVESKPGDGSTFFVSLPIK